MAFLTTNPSPFLLNVPELQNVINSASGSSAIAALTTSVTDLLTYINPENASASLNIIRSYNKEFINITNNLSLSNDVGIYAGNSFLFGSNVIGGWPYIAIQTNGIERARFTDTGFGIGTTNPNEALDVQGNATISGTLTVGAVTYPSDPTLKKNIRPYVPSAIPSVYEYEWIETGERDIGVLANEIAVIEPSCVSNDGAIQRVNYPKLVVLCLAEIRTLKEQIAELYKRIA
jgi:hypothetical protein